jgi:hypothetical protein
LIGADQPADKDDIRIPCQQLSRHREDNSHSPRMGIDVKIDVESSALSKHVKDDGRPALQRAVCEYGRTPLS